VIANLMPLFDSALDLTKRGGLIMVPIFIAGWWAWLLIVDRAFKLWSMSGVSHKRFWHVLESEGYDAAERYVQNKRGLFSEMAQQVFAVQNMGGRSVHNMIEQVSTERSYQLHKHLRTISRLAGLAPLLGLLGTVSGIVHTFDSIFQIGFGNPIVLAAGISEALLATQAGLLVAFPIAIFYNLILHRVERLETQAQSEALRLAVWLDSHPRGNP